MWSTYVGTAPVARIGALRFLLNMLLSAQAGCLYAGAGAKYKV